MLEKGAATDSHVQAAREAARHHNMTGWHPVAVHLITVNEEQFNKMVTLNQHQTVLDDLECITGSI